MAVEVIGTIKPKNNGKFPIAEAKDILMPSGKRLNEEEFGVGAASSAVSGHNTSTDAHNDIRLRIAELANRLNALANSTDEDLDQMAEVVAYIKANKTLIDAITTSKVSVADIVDNLATNVANRPLSAAQGVALKALIDKMSNITVDDELSETSENPVQNKVVTEAFNEALSGVETMLGSMLTRLSPAVTASDNGKFMQVVNGAWVAVSLTDVSVEGA